MRAALPSPEQLPHEPRNDQRLESTLLRDIALQTAGQRRQQRANGRGRLVV